MADKPKSLLVMKWWGVLLAALTLNSEAFDLDPACHRFYEAFRNPDLPYHAVGRLARRMHDNNCWPAMQGLLAKAPVRDTTPVSTDWSCSDLAADIINQDDTVVQIYNTRPLSVEFCTSHGLGVETFKMAALGYAMMGGNVGTTDMTNAELHFACGLRVGVDKPSLEALTRIEQSGRPDRLLDCTGTVYPDNITVHFYLDRFPDGGEYWAYEQVIIR